MSDLEHFKCAGPCGKLKPEYEFARHYRARSGRMAICKTCHSEKCRRRELDVLTKPASKMARYTPRSLPVPMPAAPMTLVEPEKPKPRCTCTPTEHIAEDIVVYLGASGIRRSKRVKRTYKVHDALCMIFAHNQLDNIRRSSSLDDEATKYGG